MAKKRETIVDLPHFEITRVDDKFQVWMQDSGFGESASNQLTMEQVDTIRKALEPGCLNSELHAIQRFINLEHCSSLAWSSEVGLLADAIRTLSASILFCEAADCKFQDFKDCDADALFASALGYLNQAAFTFRMAANALNRSWREGE